MDDVLSLEQQEFFKNSKVRNPDGELLKVYHGSGTKIEAFDPSFTGQGNDQYGSGFYFTTSKHVASIYTTARNKDLTGKEIPKLGGEDNPTIIEAYLNIENPIICNGYEQDNLSHVMIPNNIVYDVVRRLPTLYHQITDEIEPNPLGDYIDNFWEVKPQTTEQFEVLIKEMVESYFQDTDLQSLDILFGKYGTELRNAIHETMGYDGVLINYENHKYYENAKQIVAWFPEQIKDVNNIFPKRTPLLMDHTKNFLDENINMKKEVNKGIAERMVNSQQKLKEMQGKQQKDIIKTAKDFRPAR